jgi:predicted permease
MSLLRSMAGGLRSLFRKEQANKELDEELNGFLEMAAEEKMKQGMSRRDALRAVRLERGNLEVTKEMVRSAGWESFVETFWQDLRFGARMLLKSPGFTAIAVLTLALGIGANTAIFSVLESVLLRSLPVDHSEELVVLTDPDQHGANFGSQGGSRSLLAYSEFEYLRDHNDVFSGMFASDSSLPEREITVGGSATGGGEKQQARIKLASGGYFTTLGVKPAAGRMFTSEVDRARGGSPVAVVSYSFWKQRYGLNPSILGKTIQIHRTSFEIIGVAAPGFFGETVGESPDVWVPMMMQDAMYPGQDYLSPSRQGILNQYLWIQVMARLMPGISLAQANAAMNVQFIQCLESAAGSAMTAEERNGNFGQNLNLRPGGRGSSTLRAGFGQPLQFLMALVAMVLLIACVNVANLLLARGSARQTEFAMRLAVGAGRQRLIRQVLTESLLLAMVGAAAGIILSYWADKLLLRMVSGPSASATVQLDLHPDLGVLAFTLAVTVLTAILFGLAPSLLLTRLDLAPVLKSGAQSNKRDLRPGRLPAGKVLIVAQVSVSLILLVAAGLFVRSLSKLSEVNLGYNRENLMLFRVDAAPTGLKGPETLRLFQTLQERMAAILGIRGVSISGNGLFLHSESGDPISVEGYTPKADERMNSRMDHVGAHYFSTVGIPIRMGREIEPQDSGNGPRVGVINQTFARHFFPNTNPIGKRVRDTYPGNPSDVEIVGVVADAKYNSLREKAIERLYAPLFNPMWDQTGAVFEIRTFADPSALSGPLRQAVQAVNPLIPPIEIHTMAGLVDDSLQTDRFIKQLSAAFAVLAMLLAAIGLYGVMAYTVARRTREIGIRLALGAAPGNIRWQVLSETLALVLFGIVVGVPLALLGTHMVQSMLFGLGFADPVAIPFAAVLLVAVAAVAGFLPAQRASQVDPIVALRYE